MSDFIIVDILYGNSTTKGNCITHPPFDRPTGRCQTAARGAKSDAIFRMCILISISDCAMQMRNNNQVPLECSRCTIVPTTCSTRVDTQKKNKCLTAGQRLIKMTMTLLCRPRAIAKKLLMQSHAQSSCFVACAYNLKCLGSFIFPFLLLLFSPYMGVRHAQKAESSFFFHDGR